MRRLLGSGATAIAVVAGASLAVVVGGLAFRGALPDLDNLLAQDRVTTGDVEDVQLQVDPEYLTWLPRNASEAVWTERGIVVSVDTSSSGARLNWFRAKRPADALKPIDIPTATRDCWRVEYRALVAAPGGLDAVQECVIRGGTVEWVQRLVHVDLNDKTVRPLFDVGWLHRRLGPFTLSPDRSRAVVSEGSLICNTLLLISDDGYSHPVVSPEYLVPDQGEVLIPTYAGKGGCEGEGIALAPALSAFGDLAFEAVPGAVGESGFDRLFSHGGLYLKPAGSVDAELLVDDASDIRLAWHPTMRVLAMSANIGGDMGSIELVDPESGSMTTVSSSGWAGKLSWNPQGTKLLTIMRRPPGDGDTKIRKWLLTYKVCGELPGLSSNPRSPLADFDCRQSIALGAPSD